MMEIRVHREHSDHVLRRLVEHLREGSRKGEKAAPDIAHAHPARSPYVHDAATPFFIFGCPRSGTSLIRKMLGNHENIVVPPETLLFKMFWSFQRYYGDLTKLANQTELLKDMLATRVIRYWTPTPRIEDVVPYIKQPGFGGVVKALILSTAPKKSVHLWGEKTPRHIFYWHQIRESFPDAKVIHVVRDGRDVALSLLAARMGPKTHYAAAQLWKSYLAEMGRIRTTCPPDRFFEIRYEALLDNPEATLTRLCRFLGVSYSESMLCFFEDKSPSDTDRINAANLRQPLISSNKEKWREQMNAEELREFETVAGDFLERFGYPVLHADNPLSKRRQAFIRFVYSPVVRFISRARDHQGHMEFLSLHTVKLRRVLKYYTSRGSP